MTPKPSVWIDPIRNRKGKITSYRVAWRIPGVGRDSENTGPIKAHAEKRKRELLEKAWEGKLQIKARAGDRTFGELVARFKTDRLGDDLSARTWQIYDEAIAYFHELYGDDFPIAQFDVDKAGELKAHLSQGRKRPLGTSTLAMALRHLRAIFNYAVRPLKWIADHGLLDLEIPKPRRGGTIIQPEWLQDLVKYAPERAKRPTWVLPQSGMRPGELINLQHPQLDHAAGYVKVSRHQDLGIDTEWDRKTRNEVHVPIDAELWPYFGPPASSGWVFEGYNEREPRTRVKQLSKDWARALKRANAARAAEGRPLIPEITPHDCKHTFVTRSLEAGRPPQQVADITGTNLATLMRNYRHLINRAPRSAAGHVTFGPAPISAPALPQQEAPAGPGKARRRRRSEGKS